MIEWFARTEPQQAGDRYERPPDVNARYVTIPLVASGSAETVTWAINGKRVPRARWQIEPGTHVIVAHWATGARDSVRVVVE